MPWLKRQAATILDHVAVAPGLGGPPLVAALDRHHARLPLIAGL